jgi:hypothetical protein
MNPFLYHHQEQICFDYACFDRINGHASIQILQHPPNIVYFLKELRQVPSVTHAYLRSLAADYHRWVQEFAQRRGVEIVETKELEARDEDEHRQILVDRFYPRTPGPETLAVILKSREGARIAISQKTNGQPHLELKLRFVDQYYFYVYDRDFGRMWLRICPYFPFNVRFCLNGHEWLACRLREEGIPFRQSGNAFLHCARPDRLQALGDAFAPQHIIACLQRWLAQLVPFFTEQERRAQGFGYRLFLSQVEYCHNLIFEQRAALDRLMSRLVDNNRTIGNPDNITYLFGRYRTQKLVKGLKTRISDYHLSNPVIRSHYANSSIKQYVRDHRLLRNELTSNCTYDLGVNKGVENLPRLRTVMHTVVDRYLEVQQDILETFVDRGQLQGLRQATVTASGQRTPGIKLDDPRLLALMQSLVRFAPLAHGGRFRTRDLHADTAAALGLTTDTYTLTQLRYDLSKLRAKGLVGKVAGTQTYAVTPEGYRLCVAFLKLYHRLFAPLTAAILEPVPEDERLSPRQYCKLDRLYTAVQRALDKLCQQVGLRSAG